MARLRCPPHGLAPLCVLRPAPHDSPEFPSTSYRGRRVWLPRRAQNGQLKKSVLGPIRLPYEQGPPPRGQPLIEGPLVFSTNARPRYQSSMTRRAILPPIMACAAKARRTTEPPHHAQPGNDTRASQGAVGRASIPFPILYHNHTATRPSTPPKITYPYKQFAPGPSSLAHLISRVEEWLTRPRASKVRPAEMSEERGFEAG
ncbi:hypothetical protein B0H67DRAFT_210802 [Lasiosphaeris hirsuta]|uniref:Uncharacterized protein n=1 Tax=Lasiosphaeris hirsuta TaxID=260670 RepID=A0AA40DZ40_9PEZI|nr:hypothetical protein B0H67DRAFT_210802 [Lasiosphaeris hirsuta]